MSQGVLWLPSSPLVVNLTTAKARGRTVPQKPYVHADELME
jgi:hypothetical protein